MSRLAAALLRVAPLLALVCGLSLAAHAPQSAAAAGPLSASVTFAPSEPRCDGSSVLMIVHITNSDGSPASLAAVHAVLPNGGEPSSMVTASTNRRGIAHFVVTPPNGAHDAFFYVVTVDGGPGPHLSAAPCPLSDSKAVFVTGTMFFDRNRNGTPDGRDYAIRHAAISIEGGCLSFGCYLPPHTVRTDRRGRFEWDGLTQLDPNTIPPPSFKVCLPGVLGSHRQIVSVNGQPVTPDRCAFIGALLAGENRISVGVQ